MPRKPRMYLQGFPAHEDIHKIRECLNYNYPLGNNRFKQQIEQALERAVGHNQLGRPRVALKTA